MQPHRNEKSAITRLLSARTRTSLYLRRYESHGRDACTYVPPHMCTRHMRAGAYTRGAFYYGEVWWSECEGIEAGGSQMSFGKDFYPDVVGWLAGWLAGPHGPRVYIKCTCIHAYLFVYPVVLAPCVSEPAHEIHLGGLYFTPWPSVPSDDPSRT